MKGEKMLRRKKTRRSLVLVSVEFLYLADPAILDPQLPNRKIPPYPENDTSV